MGRLLWPLALAVAFGLGWLAADVARKPVGVQEVDDLERQVTTLQTRSSAGGDLATSRQSGSTAGAAPPSAAHARAETTRALTAAVTEENVLRQIRARDGSAPLEITPQTERSSSRPGTPAPATTVEAALERFRRYLEATNGAEGREGWQRARELVDELRGMGDAAGQALMHVLATGGDSNERRAAARLLGTLQIPQSLPLLRDIIEKDDDLLLRRAAAAGLRQLQTPDSIPVMERIVTNPAEDRFVRLSVASGLAESGRPLGVSGLAHIFAESAADGRGRDTAFRALASLNDERALPFMRQVAASQVEPGYRLRAIRYVTAQGDQQALGTLHVLMHSPTEQPSIRDAAAQAYRTLGGK